MEDISSQSQPCGEASASAEVFAGLNGVPYGREARRRLWEAAPDLLSALQGLMSSLDGESDPEHIEYMMKCADLAITKATAMLHFPYLGRGVV